MTPEERDAYRVDRTGWEQGPWDGEPDRVDWHHAGLPCFVLRNHHGCWCGYVGVALGHPAYGKGYNELDVDVHGDLTYAAKCAPPICHVSNEPDDDRHWLGFDCGHCFDQSPGMDAMLRRLEGIRPKTMRETYRTLAYARAETTRLAEQLAALK